MPANMEHKIYEQLKQTKLLPLYTATDLSYLAKVEEILLENNVPLIEVTFRSDLAGEAIKRLAKSGKLMVGAGTVRTLTEAKIAIENGAQFVVRSLSIVWSKRFLYFQELQHLEISKQQLNMGSTL